jgi:Spy/CpxP family protein refolding chaperone
MQRGKWLLAIVLIATPVFAQVNPDDANALRELGMGGAFALGDLAVRDLQRGFEPLQQLKRFFTEAKLPLSSDQQKRLGSVIDAQVDAMLNAGNNEAALRRLDLDYTRKVNEVLTPEQRNELRRYRTEQIMMRGGFQALRLIMENAQTPFTPEQEKDVQAAYVEFDRQVDQLPKSSKGAVDHTELDKLEGAALVKIVRLLTPAQRRALAASRQGTITSKVRR